MNIAAGIMDAEVARTLGRWAEAELAPWRGMSLDKAAVEDRLRDEARRNGQICLYRLRDHDVSFAPFTTMHRPHLLDPRHGDGFRAHRYLHHLREVVRSHRLAGSALVGVFLADYQLARPRAPVFCYQKPRGGRALLLPDIDLLTDDYCDTPDGRYDDPVPFADKRPQAIFVGSTTGTERLTLRDVETRANARLDAALFFREQADVTFHLPNIVQCDGPPTRAAIAALEVGGRRWSWAEQQGFRYMLSLDGNGATCSRVAAALHGHQVLAKYASPFQLYYFRGLEPWRHYVPINGHGDVLDLVAEATTAYRLHRRIAERSSAFAKRFLRRAPILGYSALLLSRYIHLFGEGGPAPAPLAPR